MARSRPWLKLDLHYASLPLVRIAGCAAVYPWIIAVLKQSKNEAEDLDIDPRVCALELGIPLEIASAQIEAMKRHGLVIKGEDGLWRDPNWEDACIDPRPPSHKRSANRNAAKHGTSQTIPSVPARTRDALGVPGSRARADRDLELEGDLEGEEEPDLLPQRAARIQPNAPTSAGSARPASPGKWWQRMGEQTGMGAIPTLMMGADGKPAEPRRWTFGALKIALQTLWPNEPVLQPGGPGVGQISRFIGELCDEPAADIERLLDRVAPEGVLLEPDRLVRPYDIKRELARMRAESRGGGRGRSPAPPGDPVAAAMALERNLLANNPAELWELAQAMAVAGEAAEDEQLRAMIAGEYERRGHKIPALFRAKGAA